jgi:hypothetical protein
MGGAATQPTSVRILPPGVAHARGAPSAEEVTVCISRPRSPRPPSPPSPPSLPPTVPPVADGSRPPGREPIRRRPRFSRTASNKRQPAPHRVLLRTQGSTCPCPCPSIRRRECPSSRAGKGLRLRSRKSFRPRRAAGRCSGLVPPDKGLVRLRQPLRPRRWVGPGPPKERSRAVEAAAGLRIRRRTPHDRCTSPGRPAGHPTGIRHPARDGPRPSRSPSLTPRPPSRLEDPPRRPAAPRARRLADLPSYRQPIPS